MALRCATIIQVGRHEELDLDESAQAQLPLPKTTTLSPKDHAEEVAIFRSTIVGALTTRELDHGELRAALHALAKERYRPPGADNTKCFSVTTLERWFYAYRKGGLAALRPAPRCDRGHAQELSPELRQLLLDIRQEHRSASVPLILRTWWPMAAWRPALLALGLSPEPSEVDLLSGATLPVIALPERAIGISRNG